MKYLIKLEATIHGVPEREVVLRNVLAELPESNLDRISGFAEAISAIERLQAAEQLKLDSEQALNMAFKQMRNFIQSNWKPSEISDNVKNVLMVW